MQQLAPFLILLCGWMILAWLYLGFTDFITLQYILYKG